MTPKEKTLAFVQRMANDVTMDDVVYKLNLFCAVENGLGQANRGEGQDHDEFFEELLAECDQDVKAYDGAKETMDKVKEGLLTSLREQIRDLAERMDEHVTHDELMYQIQLLKNVTKKKRAKDR